MTKEEKPPEPKADPDAEKRPPEDPPRRRYEFKIVPADPKNAFDFEDVADK